MISMEKCTEWTGCKNAYGYGVRRVGGRKGRTIFVHREVFAAAHGPIPTGMVVMHTCDNRACINLNHLRLGTQAENIADAMAKGRVPQLTDKAVDLDRVRDLKACGVPVKEIAAWLGVHRASIPRAMRQEAARQAASQ